MPKKKDLYSLALEDTGKPPQTSVDYRALIEWREGLPYLVSAPVRLSEGPEDALRTLLRRCLDLPYDGNDPSLMGMSQGEAMIINLSRDAANGSSEARTHVLDRLLGKPKQNIESVSLTGNLNDFLDKVAEDTQIQTVEVTPEPPSPTSTEDL